MDVANNTQTFVDFVYQLRDLQNDSSEEDQVDMTRLPRLNSPLSVTIAVLLVFLFSPMILIGNSLVLVAMYRFKRLRTPSNYLMTSLATSDLGIGMFMPVGMYLELGGAREFSSAYVCLLSYGVAITLCCVSVLVMVAIAVDRFTSLARPLRYANLITHSAIERYIAVFWIYSSLVGFTPLGYALLHGTSQRGDDCSFGSLVARPVQLFMFCAVYGPSALVLVVCYGYVYLVARGHARAISEVRHSLQRRNSPPTPGAPTPACPPRYGLALAITTGMFLALWIPFQACMLMDVFIGTKILTAWVAVYLALPILASSAFNPWVYGYRNSELRGAVRRVIDDFLTTLGFTYHSQQPCSDPIPPSAAVTNGEHASLIQHLTHKDSPCIEDDDDDILANVNLAENPCAVGGEFLLVPIARPESSGILSESPETPTLLQGVRASRSLGLVDTVVCSDCQEKVVTLKRCESGICLTYTGASVV